MSEICNDEFLYELLGFSCSGVYVDINPIVDNYEKCDYCGNSKMTNEPCRGCGSNTYNWEEK